MTPSLDELVKQGEGAQDAVDLGDGIFMSRNIANSYLVTTSGGDLLINTGTDFEAAEIKARFARVSAGPLRMITFTQGHPDHVSGWSLFNQPGVHTIAQANHPDVREYWRHLHPFYVRRIMKLWGAFMDVESVAATLPPEPVLTDSFIDTPRFRTRRPAVRAVLHAGRRDHRRAGGVASGTPHRVHRQPDGTVLRPRAQPLHPARRQDSQRDDVHALPGPGDRPWPETLINGHDVFRGTEQILATMTKVRDATAYLRDRTIDGMNSGADLWTLMRDVTLPRGLALPQVHGKVAWIVRAIWEEHVGWFRYESTTELYDVPPSSVWSDVVDLVGGTAPLTERAAGHAKAGRPLQALHLVDMVLAHAPADPDALGVKHQALEQLLAASGRENHSEVQWLEQEIKSATAEGELMKAENLYHTGIVVDDLEATMEWLAKLAGYTWTDVVTVDQEAVTPEGDVTIPMKMVYSGADPRLELLQTVPGTVWTPADSGVHHLGYWSDDVESDLATLESNGMTLEVKSYNPDGSGTLLWAYAKGASWPAHRTGQP